MSNALAIAAVTAVLKDLLQDGLIDHDLVASLGNVTVNALPPDRVPAMTDTTLSQINLFMYQVSPNPGWSPVGLPARNGRGEAISNPPLALDLHYLLTVFGAQDFHTEILLGYAMQLLHENPVLPRDAIRTALAPPSPVGGGAMLPPAVQALSAADLADQIEQIKITPHYLETADMANLWSTFQIRYRPSMAYKVTVVLIESQRSTRPALPVKQYNVYPRPFHQPVIEQVMSESSPSAPIVAGNTIVLTGHNLRGDDTRVKLGEFEVTPPPETITDERIPVTPPAGLRAGVQGVQVVHYLMISTPEAPHRGFESNVVAFVLHPAINRDGGGTYAMTVSNRVISSGLVSANLQVTMTPTLGRAQRVTLLLNEFNAPTTRPARAYSFPAPARSVDNVAAVTFAVSGVTPGIYLARVQVDGAISQLESDAQGRFHKPQVTL